MANGHGGLRRNSGRKSLKKRVELAYGLAQEKYGKDQLPDVAGNVLASINSESKWRRLLACGDVRVEADVMKYLTNRLHGMPRQQVDAQVESNVTLQVVTGVPLVPQHIVDENGNEDS